MSAVCFLFAREISDKAGVPLGMIHSSFGGTPIEAWSSPDALDRYNKEYLNIELGVLHI
jgi:sialate O-acetylesterase